jgi:hypothetical protein
MDRAALDVAYRRRPWFYALPEDSGIFRAGTCLRDYACGFTRDLSVLKNPFL